MFCVSTEVLWRKMIQLLSNKITPHFQLLPMSKVDQGPELQCLLKVEEDPSYVLIFQDAKINVSK